MEINKGEGVGQKCFKYWDAVKWKLKWGWEGSKVSQILGIITTIGFCDTYEGSVKSVKSI